jgi:hypothetical protein
MVIIGGKACQILNGKAIAKSQVEVACIDKHSVSGRSKHIVHFMGTFLAQPNQQIKLDVAYQPNGHLFLTPRVTLLELSAAPMKYI